MMFDVYYDFNIGSYREGKPPLDELHHYGTAMRSGRYPFGSGKDPNQHSGDFLATYERLNNEKATFYDEKTGKTLTGDPAIARILNMTTTQLRPKLAIAREERRGIERTTAIKLREKGYSLPTITKMMGYKNESSIRSLLDDNIALRKAKYRETADYLKQQVDEKGMIDVGLGVERYLGVSSTKLKQSLALLAEEGYPTYGGRVQQATNKNQHITMQVLCKPGTEHKEIYQLENLHQIDKVSGRSHDGGHTFDKTWTYPKSFDSKRLEVKFDEDGGRMKDGLVEIRRGVEDVSLGNSTYAQVRILVDGKKYIKGMAVYADDLPEGVDVRFNTNKSKSKGKLGALKDITDDPDNPFGSSIKQGIDDPTVDDRSDSYMGGQRYYVDPKTGKKELSVINKRAAEGDWAEWKDKLPSQFLSKQPMQLINKQLNLAESSKQLEFDEIMTINNPTVKQMRLRKFAEECESAAVHLGAAALPRQKYHVLIPDNTLKDNEVYAPRYNDGEQVALIRYPHGGTFEIPILTVNNKNRSCRKVLGKDPVDAVCINHKNAEQLSGADFDGDTVMIIPTNSKNRITNKPPLKDLEGFDPQSEYPEHKDMTYMKYETVGKDGKRKITDNTQKQMGMISNLITDMTLRDATDQELARAVKHSMVVIDAAKHKLDYKQSEKDNEILSLKRKYQGHKEEGSERITTGAYTLISKASSDQQIPKHLGSMKVNQKGKPWYDPSKPEGAEIWNINTKSYINKAGKEIFPTQTSTKMREADDAFKLSSGTPQEVAYAEYANKLKALANSARKEAVYTKNPIRNPEAAKKYAKEVADLEAKLHNADINKPLERQAHITTNIVMKAKIQDNPQMTKEEIKKASNKTLVASRESLGAKRVTIDITDNEWKAIQEGAVSHDKLSRILLKADDDRVRSLSTPKAKTTLPTAKTDKLAAMRKSGMYSIAEMAKALGVSTTVITQYMKG